MGLEVVVGQEVAMGLEGVLLVLGLAVVGRVVGRLLGSRWEVAMARPRRLPPDRSRIY